MESFFMYLSAAEGFMIVCMLGWEIFWLRRMYQVLWNMPTAKQIAEMVEMIRGDRETIRSTIATLSTVFDKFSGMFSGFGGLIK